jgi:homoserine O-succinyltransferase
MPLLLDTAKSAAAVELRSANCITIGLVNNMPDAALEATKRQFVDLIRAAATGCVVRLKLFAMADVPRSARARENLAGRYRDVAELWNERLDGLIVTGTEPRAKDLEDEPYWAALTAIVDGAREHTASTIWSCLAAHAAVLHSDGIVRRPLKEKLSGVFDCDTVAALPQLPIGAPRLRVPHSRYNDLPERVLTGSGYHVLTRSAAAGVDMFARVERHSLFVFLQGHPEYDGGSLLREYRRDVGRFLRGEREHYPALPQGYFDEGATAAAKAFRKLAQGERQDEIMRDFPLAALEAGLAAADAGGESDWRPSAVGIYQSWIDYLKERRAAGKAGRWSPRPRPLAAGGIAGRAAKWGE